MQQTLNPNWARNARLNGVFRYHGKVIGRALIWILLILLASQVISLLLPLVTHIQYTFSGIYADLSFTLIVSCVFSIIAAHQSTRFLLRFGTSRLSVWLGNVVSLCAGAIVFLLGTLLLSMMAGGLTLALANAMPRKYIFQVFFGELQGPTLYTQTLTRALAALPSYILYTAEWTCLFYLLGCCLRRNRGVTLAVIIGVPMLLAILMLVPAVRQATSIVENADERQMLILGVQWMKYLTDFVHFVETQWPIIQLVAAVVSLPLSYLCMRNTQQP